MRHLDVARVQRSSTSSSESPCFDSSAAYSLLYSVPICGGFDFPSVVTVVRKTLPPVTIGDDQPRRESTDHSTFSVVDQRSGRRASEADGFDVRPARTVASSCPPPGRGQGMKTQRHKATKAPRKRRAENS